MEKDKLWEAYGKKRTPELREQLILEYAPLVKLVAGRLSMYLGYNVENDDLVSYGIFGLIDAIDKFDPFKEVKFETYASLSIRGSILDQILNSSPSRSAAGRLSAFGSSVVVSAG